LATVETVKSVETFTEEERARLAPHFTKRRSAVFGLVNLRDGEGRDVRPLLAVPGTLRRMFLDEFADSLPEVSESRASKPARRRALRADLPRYGDDSVAQLERARRDEWTSNVLTKSSTTAPRCVPQQSTRYISYDTQLDGYGYRYHRDDRFGADTSARWTIC